MYWIPYSLIFSPSVLLWRITKCPCLQMQGMHDCSGHWNISSRHLSGWMSLTYPYSISIQQLLKDFFFFTLLVLSLWTEPISVTYVHIKTCNEFTRKDNQQEMTIKVQKRLMEDYCLFKKWFRYRVQCDIYKIISLQQLYQQNIQDTQHLFDA